MGKQWKQWQILLSQAPKSLQTVTAATKLKEHPDVQAGFRKGRGTRDQIANIRWIMEKVREFQKNIYFCFVDYANTFDCVDHNKLWKILKQTGIPDHLTCLLRNAGLGEAQAGIKIARRNINNLRYADDTTLMAKAKKN